MNQRPTTPPVHDAIIYVRLELHSTRIGGSRLELRAICRTLSDRTSDASTRRTTALGTSRSYATHVDRRAISQSAEVACELLSVCAGIDAHAARVELVSTILAQVVSVEYRADAVVVLRDSDDTIVSAEVVEVQLHYS
jgi:hypothetical protein